MFITDFHPDWFYRPGAKLNEFCHAEPEKYVVHDTLDVQFARPKKDHKEARAGFWAPAPSTECDTSIPLVNATFDFVKREIIERQGGIDFVIWTGDNVRHDNDNRYPRTLQQIYASNAFMVSKMQELFGADKYSEDFIPVVPTVGNNDVYPHNIMFAGPNSRTIAEYKSMWKAWVPPEQSHTFDRGAYFHMSVAPKLSVISLNSLYFYENNKAVDGCSSKDEAGSLQLDWLEIQLKLFRQQKIKVWVIGHVPPTERQWYDGCYYRYANLMIEFRDLVVGQIFGHVNIDHFYFMEHNNFNAVTELKEPEPDTTTSTHGNDISILKSPLDVLTDAREIFDGLPVYPADSKKSTSADLDKALGHLAVVNVGPSVVPNYFPTLRVYEYLTAEHTNVMDNSALIQRQKHGKDSKKKKRKKKKKKKPTIPPVDSLGPAFVQQKYTPLRYVQWYLNTTTANANHSSNQVEYEVEYDTSASPYSMKDLTVASWVKLGNAISGMHGSGKVPKRVLEDDAVLGSMRGIDAEDLLDEAGDLADGISANSKGKTKKKKKKKNRRHDGLWKIFVFRGFVSTGLEHEYRKER
ncbi:protein of unknown function [Taphrina deformans PYCC 5710]|uniref:Endopolyphosphatase n=1 Tax=Taphrina deformans (strain PYCC 5710 / ATCC 11124 / CBS 356.35 / IMI 108563 / JCM 9778 / NBRC 8474) TaxID=1097556 RepID=R4XFQ5_TAPDE|nr:protein of unknown function [Taphrina deformans PYCC 5710]|eukprot:CCG84583.1 protein of unknown function [Taphrina deformans PYCC 5710]